MGTIHPALTAGAAPPSAPGIAFFVYPVLRFPRNNREYYLSRELLSRGWRVTWLVPQSGRNEGVPVDDLILRYADLDVRGRTYMLPLYLGLLLRARGIRLLWLSGWSIRSTAEIRSLVRIMAFLGIRTVYDTIDPKVLFEAANDGLSDPDSVAAAQREVNAVYAMCSRVLCVTPEMKELMAAKGAEASRLRVARWGCDGALFSTDSGPGDFRRRLGIADSTFVVGWLGSMTAFKGLKEIIVPLIGRLSRRKDVHFLLAGDGPLYDEVAKLVAEVAPAAATMLGRVPYVEAAEFTAALDAYVVTTDPGSDYGRSICPVKCYDAVAVGTPLVTTRTPATEHLAQLAENVRLCAYHIDAFERGILEVIDAGGRKTDAATLPVAVSHQGVSVKLAQMLEELTGRQDDSGGRS